MRLLVVEDNRELADWLTRLLRHSQYTVDWVGDGRDADHALQDHEYALAILDLSLPGLSGIEILKRMRQRGDATPVIILTANASLGGRVAGLDAGADDYLAKPFDMAELEARIRVQLRRANSRASAVFEVGDLVLDMNARQFRIGAETLALTPREHSVLEQLVMKSGETISKTRLRESIFGFNDEADESVIEVYIHRLRKKLEGSRVRIVTLRGLGYLLHADEA
jgi:two-component system response regulator TctD